MSDTIGPEERVLLREVSLLSGVEIYTNEVFGEENVSCFKRPNSGVFFRRSSTVHSELSKIDSFDSSEKCVRIFSASSTC